MNRPHNGVIGLVIDARIDGSGNAKVGDFNPTGFGDQNIMRLNITVYNAVIMRIFQGFANVEGNLDRRINRQMAVFFDVFF